MLINRNPFAREELHKSRRYVSGNTGCQFCFCAQQTPKTNRVFLYEYRIESDGGRVTKIPGLFCCKSCMELYHGRSGRG